MILSRFPLSKTNRIATKELLDIGRPYMDESEEIKELVYIIFHVEHKINPSPNWKLKMRLTINEIYDKLLSS